MLEGGDALFSTEPNASFAIRLSCIFQSILSYCVREWSSSSTTDHKKGSLLNKTLQAIGYFAAKSQRTKLLCVLGWQRSLLLQMCTALPFEYIHQTELRLVLMPSLVVVLLRNPAGVEAIRNEFCLSWLITYLKEGLKQQKECPLNYKIFSQMLNQKDWPEALDYFKSKTHSTLAISS